MLGVLVLILYLISTLIDIGLYCRVLKDYKALKQKVSLLENKEVNL